MSATITAEPSEASQEPGGLSGRNKLLLVIGAIVLAILLVVYLVAFSPVFGVSTVKVSGLKTLTQSQVLAAADVPHGRPLARLDTAAIQRRVETLPAVAVADVSTSWPGTVEITVTERVPVAFVQVGSDYRLVDSHGQLYDERTHRPAALPLLVLPTGGDGSKTYRSTYAAAATVAASLPASLRPKVASVQALSADSISLLMNDNRVVRWGSSDRNADKARVLAVLLGQPGTQIDVTDPDMPFTH